MGIKPADPVEILGKLVVTAEACVEKQSWSTASSLTAKADKLASSSSVRKDKTKAGTVSVLRTRVAGLQKQLDTEARQRVAQSRQYYEEKKYAEALKGYRSVVYCFGDSPAADEARKALAEAAIDPERKAMIEQLQAKEMAETIARMIDSGLKPCSCGKCDRNAAFYEKMKAAPRVEQVKALTVPCQMKVLPELERLVKLYPKLPEGTQADSDLKKLKADEKFQAALAKEADAKKARGLLSLAEAYRSINKHDKAAKFLKEILEKYPKSEVAGRAREMLDEINLGSL